MAPRRTFRDLVGILKDKASISKATLFSKPSISPLHLAILRATTHNPSTPPDNHHIAAVLSLGGQSSRATASVCIEALMFRLHNTHNSYVAIKCLITIHSIIKKGSFILLDQLSIYPNTGGRNYLNLSMFRDNSSPETWELSSFVRWYARVLEYQLLTSRNHGYFLSSWNSKPKSKTSYEKEISELKEEEEKVSSLLNGDLLKELDVLVGLIEEICKATELLNFGKNMLINEVMILVNEDYNLGQKKVWVRFNEVRERMGNFSFVDSVELVCVLKRLEICKEKVLLLFLNRKGSKQDLVWDLIDELKEKIEKGRKEEYGNGKMMIMLRREKGSESARFGERVMMVESDNSVRFSSARFDLNRALLPIVESGSLF